MLIDNIPTVARLPIKGSLLLIGLAIFAYFCYSAYFGLSALFWPAPLYWNNYAALAILAIAVLYGAGLIMEDTV